MRVATLVEEYGQDGRGAKQYLLLDTTGSELRPHHLEQLQQTDTTQQTVAIRPMADNLILLEIWELDPRKIDDAQAARVFCAKMRSIVAEPVICMSLQNMLKERRLPGLRYDQTGTVQMIGSGYSVGARFVVVLIGHPVQNPHFEELYTRGVINGEVHQGYEETLLVLFGFGSMDMSANVDHLEVVSTVGAYIFPEEQVSLLQ